MGVVNGLLATYSSSGCSHRLIWVVITVFIQTYGVPRKILYHEPIILLRGASVFILAIKLRWEMAFSKSDFPAATALLHKLSDVIHCMNPV